MFKIVFFLLLASAASIFAYLPASIAGKGEELVKLNANSTATCILGTQTGCSTAVAEGLTNQIIKELGTLGYSFKTLDSTWIHCSRS